MKDTLTIALAGNPNSGKTTVFNNITGARQHVGNYAGVTVEKKEGAREHRGVRMTFVDLPGTYSLSAYSMEELIARNYVVDEAPDVVVDIVDASNLERNLYLVAQFIEMGVPLVVVLNMIDVAEGRGLKIDVERLAELLGCPVVSTVGSRNQGTGELLDAILDRGAGHEPSSPERVRYGREIEDEVAKLKALLGQQTQSTERRPHRWLAVKLLEHDSEAIATVRRECQHAGVILQAAEESMSHLERVFGDDAEGVIADRRYGFARGAYRAAGREEREDRLTRSDHIDKVVCSRLLGPILFFGAMYLVFQLTFTLAGPPTDWIEWFFAWAGNVVASWWPPGSESDLRSLLVDGIIGGVGGVITFLPNILLLFMAIAFLEDSGYMARAAFLVDKVMHKLGLHGKSFIPMVIGFGCSVPGIMATRTLDSRRDRLTTLLVLPLMSCSARLPIYALIIPAFFPRHYYAQMLLLIYCIGIALAVVCAKVLRATLLRGEAVPFVMELPPYRLPTLRGIVLHMWERGWLYFRKAGTLILGASIVLWALTRYPKKPDVPAVYERLAVHAVADQNSLSYRVHMGDLRGPREFADLLKTRGPRPQPSPARRVWALLSPEGQARLAHANRSEEELAQALADALSGLLARPDLYDSESFHSAGLNAALRRALEAATQADPSRETTRLNRALLAAAFPEHIMPGPRNDLPGLAQMLGVPEHWTALAQALRTTEGDEDAARGRGAAKAGADCPEIKAFLAMRGQIVQVREAVQKTADEIEHGRTAGDQLDMLALEKKRSEALAVLRARDPRTFDAALSCLDEVEAPLATRMATLARARQAEMLEHSIAGRVGQGMEVVLRPLGFDWRIGTALIGALAAKEVFVAQLGIVFSLGERDSAEGLRAALRSHYSPLVAFCIMLFTLISAPCMATIAATKRETNSWRWPLFQLGGLTALAYVFTFMVYSVGRLLGVGLM